MNQGVPVAILLRGLAESRGIDLELLAGGGGLDRFITNPHPQKTGLALSGFDQYPREGRILVLGESEVRFLESLPAAERICAGPPVPSGGDPPSCAAGAGCASSSRCRPTSASASSAACSRTRCPRW